MVDEDKTLPAQAEQNGDGNGRHVETRREQSELEHIFDKIYMMAKDPNVDPAKMVAITDMTLRLRDDRRQEQFNQDKIAALRDMPVISKRGAITNKAGGVQSRYSKFEDIMRVVKPILDRHNLAISFNVGSSGQMVTVTPILSHANGHVEKGDAMLLPLDTTGSKNGTQGAGSSTSYGKRHTCKAMLNIVEEGEDNDGVTNAPVPMEKWQETKRDEGQRAASNGLAAYQEWYHEQTNMVRGWLVDSGEHERLKTAAENFGA